MTRPLDEQIVVLTGASSGIGRVAARMFAERGARLVLAARGTPDLREVAADVVEAGSEVLVVPTDVTDDEAVELLGAAAVERFGRIDTWVNNAGVAVFGRVEDLSVDDFRRVLDVNFLGVVRGSQVALHHMRERGGTLINVGSVLSGSVVELLGAYNASKHAVRGFTDTLRMEVRGAGIPIEVCALLPASMDTPLFEHSASRTGLENAPMPPVYAPEVAARAMVRLAERPQRELVAGGGGAAVLALRRWAPGIVDRLASTGDISAKLMQYSTPKREPDNLDAPRPGADTGNWTGPVLRHSAYTWVMGRAPGVVRSVVGAGAVAAATVAPGALKRLVRK